jgi:hypothetical protein
VFYRNESIAIFTNNIFVGFEKPPVFFFGGCRPDVFIDGRPMINCLTVNQTRIVFFPPLNFKNTIVENATAAIKDEMY